MRLFGLYLTVDVVSLITPGSSTESLHIENPDTGKTFCGKKPWRIANTMFVPDWDCKRCYARAEKAASKHTTKS